MVQCLTGGFGLVGVVLRLVPAGGDDRGPDEGGEQGGEGAAVGAGGGVGDVAGRAAQGVGGLVLSADLGALGASECPCRRSQFGSGVVRCPLRGGLDEFAERRD